MDMTNRSSFRLSLLLLLMVGLRLSVGNVGAATTPSCPSLNNTSPQLYLASLAQDDLGARRVIEQEGEAKGLSGCVSEREIRQLAEPGKRITYIGEPTTGYPLVVLLAVARLPQSLTALKKQAPASIAATDPEGNTALAWAARLDYPEMVDSLIEAGLNPLQANSKGETTLSLLLNQRGKSADKTKIVKALINAVPKEQREKPKVQKLLWMAAYFGDFDAMQVLLNAGVPPHYVALEGRTALISAVEEGNLAAVRQLLKSGAQVSSHPYREKTVFDIASAKATNGGADAVEINRLIQIERRNLEKLGHDPEGTAPEDWHSESDMEKLRLMQSLKW